MSTGRIRIRSGESLTALVPPVPARFDHVLAEAERHRDNLRYRLDTLEGANTWTEWAGTPQGDAERVWRPVSHRAVTAELRSHDAPLWKRPAGTVSSVGSVAPTPWPTRRW